MKEYAEFHSLDRGPTSAEQLQISKVKMTNLQLLYNKSIFKRRYYILKPDMYLPKPRQDPKEQNCRVHKYSHKLMNKVKIAAKMNSLSHDSPGNYNKLTQYN